MFTVQDCQPATELFGFMEVKQSTDKKSTRSTELEQRLQFFGIKNTPVQEEFRTNECHELKAPNEGIICKMFESTNDVQKLSRKVSEGTKRSTRSWLWHQYISQHGNCSLCERPLLDGLNEQLVMLSCAHVLHFECAEEMRLNRGDCPRCKTEQKGNESTGGRRRWKKCC